MQSNLYRLVLVTLLFLLVTSCSSVESEPGWPASSEWVAEMPGMGGRLRSERVADMPRNTHFKLVVQSPLCCHPTNF